MPCTFSDSFESRLLCSNCQFNIARMAMLISIDYICEYFLVTGKNCKQIENSNRFKINHTTIGGLPQNEMEKHFPFGATLLLSHWCEIKLFLFFLLANKIDRMEKVQF